MKLISSVIAIFAALLLLYNFGVFDPPIVKACESNLKRYLFAPSSYARNRFIPGERPATRAEVEENYRNFLDLKSFYLEEFDKGTMTPVIYTAILNFSALSKNAEPVTTTVVCSYYSDDGSTVRLATWAVLPRPVDTSALSQIIRDTSNDPLPTEEEKLENTKPMAPYAGWVRDTLRQLLG